MPPPKGIDRGLDGTALKALEEAGHGRRVVIVDPSYDIPPNVEVVNYHGDSSSNALRGILQLMPVDDGYLTIMDRDESTVLEGHLDTEQNENDMFDEIAEEFDLIPCYVKRLDDDKSGFYSQANTTETRSLFIRTRDTRAYACAMFVLGHSQE